MNLEVLNNRRVWRASDGDMWDEIAVAVYADTPGAFEALADANAGLVRQRGERLQAGDIVRLPTLAASSVVRRIRLFS